jgi:hypothetical protein
MFEDEDAQSEQGQGGVAPPPSMWCNQKMITLQHIRLRFIMLGGLALCALMGAGAYAAPPEKQDGAIRIASFNASLYRRNPGLLAQELRLGGSAQIDAVAEIIQIVRPDIILINEFDFDVRGVSARLFKDTLLIGRGEAAGVDYPHVLIRPANTGVQSGFDLDKDGRTGGPADAFGFGFFEGQYGMVIFSRFPFDDASVRTFQLTKWADMPANLIPEGHFGEAETHLRLSSKNHIDAPVILPGNRRIHLLASHPTPPVFDGPEDANGRRNHDEVRFWVDYVEGEDWIVDDAGLAGALKASVEFVVLGDLNVDPEDGAGRGEVLTRLMELAPDPFPFSKGGAAAASKGANLRHRGPAGLDTADWKDIPGPGNLRADYVLPAARIEVIDSGVFWPAVDDPLRRLVGNEEVISSDHRLVWVDIR